ncbi:MAG: hypothetical protein ABIK28_08700 [Planctomycetota bacterium]
MRIACISGFIGTGIGLLFGYLLWSSSMAASAEPKGNESITTAIPDRSDTIESEISTVEERAKPEETSEPAPIPEKEESRLFSKALIEYFQDRFTQVWNQQRSVPPGPDDLATGEGHFQEAVLALPAKLAELQTESLNKKDSVKQAMAQGGGVHLLEMTEEGLYIPDPDDVEWEIIDHCCDRRVSGDLVDGTRFLADTESPLETGATLFFPQGVHVLDEGRLRGSDKKSMPSDIVIKGAGMNATLLQIHDIGPRDHIERLSIQDLTLDVANDGLFDLKKGSLVIDLNSVRIVCFDAGHGGCDLFSAKGCLVRAQNSEFIGGYGSSPGAGHLFDKSPVLARFVNCRFELLDLALKQAGKKGRISFQNCVFVNLDQDPMLSSFKNVDYHHCVTESVLAPDTNKRTLRKELTDLFPQVNAGG